MRLIFLLLGWFIPIFSFVEQIALEEPDRNDLEFVWEASAPQSFTEISLYWEGKRPDTGRLTFLVSVESLRGRSPWLFYSEWGEFRQIMFRDHPEGIGSTFDGKIRVQSGNGTKFRVKVIASGGADLKGLQRLSVISTDIRSPSIPSFPEKSIALEIKEPESLIMLRHPRYLDLSLPTCMAMLLNYEFKERRVDALDFAREVQDNDTGDYEHISLNIAKAADFLKGEARVLWRYLDSFDDLYALLQGGTPVIVPISGWLPGSLRPYHVEHAICVTGYDAETKKIKCVDPAFPGLKAVFISYDIEPFLRCWAKHGNRAIYLSSSAVLLK